MKLALLSCIALALSACAPSFPPAEARTGPAAQRAPAEPSIRVTEEMGSPHIGELAPDFELPDQDGKVVRLSEARGSIVVLTFVASFCPFSQAEQPHLARLADDYVGRNVRVIAVGIPEPEAAYRSYVGRMPMRFPVLRDADGRVALQFTPPRALPELNDRTKVLVTSNLVIDPQGMIRFFTILDTFHFDAELVHVRQAVDHLLAPLAG